MIDPVLFQNVPRGTIDKFEAYYQEILKWAPAINLISPSDLERERFYDRHISDALTVSPLLFKDENIYDIGSGGGLPGIILSMLGHRITMVEIDSRKCVFLEEMVRRFSLNSFVLNVDIRTFSDMVPKTVVSRSFASIDKTFEWTKHLHVSRYLMLKGKKFNLEIAEAEKSWQFKTNVSFNYDKNGCIVEAYDVHRKIEK